MSDSPDVSVVMSVYNGALNLRKTIDSVLSQQGVRFEFVIVNDGSTDESPKILEDYAKRDARVQVIHQENQGLTLALIRGCAAAKGNYIARQDVGDISLPGRLVKQMECVNERPDASLVSCGTRFVGPADEFLYEVVRSPSDASERLRALDLTKIEGPSSHPSTIFPRALYHQVGGYRSDFYFAQDLDLWIRLTEEGEHVVLPEVLYQAGVLVQSISGLYRDEQVETAKLILESARLRRRGVSDSRVLERAGAIGPSVSRKTNRLQRAKALYFIGSCLRKRSDPVATHYFQEALRLNPLHVKSAVRLLFG
jgi:glycosyltransferase involved in cell wall biosynthesis